MYYYTPQLRIKVSKLPDTYEMEKYLIIVMIFLLLACANRRDNNSLKKNSKNLSGFVKDTLINGYQTKISLKTDYLLKGIENELHIEIYKVPQDQIVIYAKTSEARVNFSENHDNFMVIPTMTSNRVTINLNTRKDGQIVAIGEIELKTK